MVRLIKKMLLILLVVVLVTPAWADQPQQFSFPINSPLQWYQVPGVQQVQYAPNQNLDIFRYGQQYYCLSQGQWYSTPSLQNSWIPTQNIPQVFYQIPYSSFKNPPGWAKGNKTGWNGPIPPGQVNNQLQWHQIPGVQQVQYAPNQNHDIFQYGQQYYYFNQGQWYNTPSLQSSWVQTQNVPQVFNQIPQTYFKNSPGWNKGKKTGWGNSSMPPGQVKNNKHKDSY